ncbi:MAG: sulfatase-like hydrolase/transferase [Planctomycetota bacterium]
MTAPRLSIGAALLAALTLLAGCSDSRPSVLLISIDTLRADHLGTYGDASARTPSLDALAKEGVTFLDAQAPVPLTLPSHTTLMTGLDPYLHGVHDNGLFVVPPSAQTLAESLRAEDYWTGAVIGSYPLIRRFGIDQGFEVYDDRLAVSGTMSGEIVERPANEVTDRTIALLKRAADSGKAFFLWAHYFDPHFPYEAPAKHTQGADSPYAAEVSFTDAQVGRLLDELDALGLEENTLVVITADHGESLGQHQELTHGTFAYSATLHVPWLMRMPGKLPAGKRVESLVRTQDIAPTILDLLELPPLRAAGGQSVRPLWSGKSDDRVAYCETFAPEYSYGWSKIIGLRTGTHRFLLSPDPELYDVRADPGEQQDICEQHPERVAALQRQLEKIREISARDALSHQSTQPDYQALAALGYTSRPREVAPWIDPSLPSPKERAHLLESFSKLERWTAGGRADRAIELARSVLEEDPQNPHVREILAFNLQASGEVDEAIEEYQRAIQLNPGNPFLYNTVAKLCADRGEPDKAKQWLRAGLEASPNEPTLAMGLAQMQFMSGAKDEALETLRAALDANPGDVTLHLTIAGVYLRLERFDDARRELDWILEQDPENRQAKQMRRSLKGR